MTRKYGKIDINRTIYPDENGDFSIDDFKEEIIDEARNILIADRVISPQAELSIEKASLGGWNNPCHFDGDLVIKKDGKPLGKAELDPLIHFLQEYDSSGEAVEGMGTCEFTHLDIEFDNKVHDDIKRSFRLG